MRESRLAARCLHQAQDSTSASSAGKLLRHQAPHTDLEALWRHSLMDIIALRGNEKAKKVTAYICS